MKTIFFSIIFFLVLCLSAAAQQEPPPGAQTPAGSQKTQGPPQSPKELGLAFCDRIRGSSALDILALLPPSLRDAMKKSKILDLVGAELDREMKNNPVAECNPGETKQVNCSGLAAVKYFVSRTGQNPGACAEFQAWTITSDGEERDFRAAMVRIGSEGWYILPQETPETKIPPVWKPPPAEDPNADMSSLGNSICIRGMKGDAKAVFDLMHPSILARTRELMGGDAAWNALMADAEIKVKTDPIASCNMISSDEQECDQGLKDVLKSALGLEIQTCGVLVITTRQKKSGEHFEHIPVLKIAGKWYLGGQ